MRPRQAIRTIVSAALLAIVPSLAHAQAVGGGYRGNLPGYYYSAGGYSGGYYFSPGYYPNRASVAVPAGTLGRVAPVQGYFATSTYRVASGPVGRTDYSTGRDNIPVPLAKPWLRPLR